MGRYRGKRIPDEHNPDYENVEGMEEHWYWYNFGYEEGLLDDYNRNYPEEIKRLRGDIASMQQLAAARERVLQSFTNEHFKLSEQQLQTVGNPAKDERTDESTEETVVSGTSG